MRGYYRQSQKFLWALCLCIQIAACGALAETGDQITQQELVAQIESEAAPLILDVRTAEEYEAGHIPGAINVHFRELDQRLDEIALPADGTVVVYCERGIRANIAKRTLNAAGITSVLHLKGDISQWRKNNLPLERERSFSETEGARTSVVQPVPEHTQLATSLTDRWIVNAVEAKQLIDQGATVLDTRKLALKRIQGSVYVDWRQFSPENAVTRGKLLEQDEVLTQQLQSLGISSQRPVVVVANPPQGWGEDGRIVWMLRTLGHAQVAMVDGGFEALMAVKAPIQSGAYQPPAAGDFVVARNLNWDIQRDELRAQLGRENVVVIDTREAREFAGKTPYGEQRGGHVPGAIHFYFKEFWGQDGKLLPPDDLRAKLQNQGITPETQIVVYCTGGIRSGWLASVLITLGYQARNYAGSMWEWSAAPADSYPLFLDSITAEPSE